MLKLLLAVVGMVYLFLLMALGIWAARKVHGIHRKGDKLIYDSSYARRLFLADPEMSAEFVVLSMTATWMSAGFLNGTIAAVYKDGILWCQTHLGFAISLALGGRFFVSKIKNTDDLTMMDPFQRHFGKWVVLFLALPCIIEEFLWSAVIFHVLGSYAQVLVGTDWKFGVSVVAAITVVIYTALGGMYAVLYTDAIQFFTTAVGIWFCASSIVGQDAAAKMKVNLMSGADSNGIWEYIDTLLMSAFGGIPWPVYIQRVLSCGTVSQAKFMSYASACGCVFLIIPPVIIGATARTTNFILVGHKTETLQGDDAEKVFAISIELLAPYVTKFIGVIVITAVVTTAVDASMLSVSTLLSHNLYAMLARPSARPPEIIAALRVSVVICAVASIMLSTLISSPHSLWRFSSDLTYVLLFPQFVGIFYFPSLSNSYGSFASFLIGLSIRVLIGDEAVGIPAFIPHPFGSKDGTQNFPYRTICMALCFIFLLICSGLARTLFHNKILPMQCDFCHCFSQPKKVGERSKTDETQAESKSSVSPVDSKVPQSTTAAILTKYSASTKTVSDIEHTSSISSLSPDHIVRKNRNKLKADSEHHSLELVDDHPDHTMSSLTYYAPASMSTGQPPNQGSTAPSSIGATPVPTQKLLHAVPPKVPLSVRPKRTSPATTLKASPTAKMPPTMTQIRKSPARSPKVSPTATSTKMLLRVTPNKTSPAATPKRASPTATPSKTSPAATSKKALPTAAPTKTSVTDTPNQTSPVLTPGRAPPTATPKKTSPAETPKKASPATTPKETSHAATPKRASPTATPNKTSPAATPKKVSPAATPTKTLLTATPNQTSPATTPKRVSPTATPNKASPAVTPKSSLRVVTPQMLNTRTSKASSATSSRKGSSQPKTEKERESGMNYESVSQELRRKQNAPMRPPAELDSSIQEMGTNVLQEHIRRSAK
ncbi:high-affinity choline transporter 1-like [Ornithodoros turicata]|uniref:high-affinity choline transporter 1-like n=1 Tax=Ornithodoros turicata TaxID=34597 RepID=UPI0031392046